MHGSLTCGLWLRLLEFGFGRCGPRLCLPWFGLLALLALADAFSLPLARVYVPCQPPAAAFIWLVRVAEVGVGGG